jgi:hypothetical protein
MNFITLKASADVASTKPRLVADIPATIKVPADIPTIPPIEPDTP